MEKRKSIGIIGAGVAGLASAIRQAVRGYEVHVYEANDYPGGKLSTFRMGEFRFDAGPSLFTMPQYVTELFELAGESAEEHFQYIRLPEICRYFWEDNTRLTAWAEPERFAGEMESKLGIPSEKVIRLLDNSRAKYDLTGRIFLEKSLHRAETWLHGSVAKALTRLPSYDLFSNMNQVHERELGHKKAVQLFNRFATYNGSNPYKAPGLLSISPHCEHGIGAFFPRGGIRAITQSLYQLALRQGVHFHFSRPVDEILVEGKRAMGIRFNGQVHHHDVLISNMDVFYTYRRLLPGLKAPEKTLRQEKSTSALIFYWGIDRTYEELDVHNILFSEDYRKEFEYLEAGKVAGDATVYIHISSKVEPEDAPAGSENWFVMVNVPPDQGQDWDALIPRIRRQTLDKINRILNTDLEKHIREEDYLDPRRIQTRTSSHLGALYGTSSNNRLAAFLRHPNFSRKIRNLYFCGGSVHPGGGIPLCLLSAKIVDESLNPSVPVTKAPKNAPA
jgi:phytoene desaturase